LGRSGAWPFVIARAQAEAILLSERPTHYCEKPPHQEWCGGFFMSHKRRRLSARGRIATACGLAMTAQLRRQNDPKTKNHQPKTTNQKPPTNNQ
jgi:hypothetical protein